MSIDYTSDALVESVKRRGLIPNSQQLYTNSEMCKILTEELHSCILPMLMSMNEDYFVYDYDQNFTVGVNTYNIPQRAVGVKVRDVVLLNSNNQEVSLPRLDPDFIKKQWVSTNFSPWYNSRGFYFKNNKVYIYPDVSNYSSFSLRIKYYRRPNNIVPTTECGRITAIDTGTNVVTLTRLPSTWTTATTFDIIQGRPPFDSLDDDATITAYDSNNKTITLTTLPTDMIVGDWVAEANCSPIAQLPYEVFNILEQRAVVKVLEGLGDTQGLKQAAEVYTDMIDKFQKLITPRADGSPKRIRRSSVLFGGGRVRQNWW